MKNTRVKNRFTLIELLVAMAVLAIFLLALMQFFSSTQNLVSSSTSRMTTNENARVAMDLIASDIQSVYYCEDVKKIYFAPYYDATAGENGSSTVKKTENLRFSTSRTEPLTGCLSKVTWVSYEFDTEKMKLNLYSHGDKDSLGKAILDTTTWNPFKNVDDSNGVTILENLVEFNVVCYYWYKDKLDVMVSDEFYAEADTKLGEGFAPARIPDAVKISFGIVDDETMDKLSQLCGMALDEDSKNGKLQRPSLDKINSNTAAKELLDSQKRTFSRTITLDIRN